MPESTAATARLSPGASTVPSSRGGTGGGHPPDVRPQDRQGLRRSRGPGCQGSERDPDQEPGPPGGDAPRQQGHLLEIPLRRRGKRDPGVRPPGDEPVTEEIMEENGIAPTRRGSQEAL